MKALICGRGKSIEKYKSLFDEKFDYIYLVNAFNRFIVEDTNLLDFFTKKSKEGSKIIQQINLEMVGIDHNFLQKVKIHKVYCTRLKHTSENVWWREYFNQDKFLKSHSIKVEPQPESVEEYMKLAGGSLSVAIFNAIKEHNAKDVTIIGQDFYESDYYLSHRGADWHVVSQKKVQERLKNSFSDVIKSFPETTFNIYTTSTYSNNIENCKVFNLTS